ncbi:unnamed protein product [Vitrella brassicaformis CCMP3155]|uniref:Uncharacterized protein n=1 Tax=Vitrella brassicaformis (strain CCMP3155) TaxID=1169540 RepID=A0A0G4GGG5_VITBC|nr:unnamed protein product [Vitrella brassicaformis CCMP3155]|eukprot:CEM28708.1 unnamed protein product [Vitrella brassicaformis CCMP3155]
MKYLLCVLPALFLAASAAFLADEPSKNRPISKVVVLLKDMAKQLEKEQEDDEEVYDKLACWCETNDKAKTKAIEKAEAKITEITANIEEYTATAARLETEIKNLQEEIAANVEALAKATEIRNKEHEEFSEEEKDMLQSIQALKAAVTVVSKHHTAPPAALASLSTVIKHQLHRYPTMISSKQRRAVLAFVQRQDPFSKSPTFKQPYAPQSGEIFGVLQSMQESFEQNLSDAQKEEMERQKAFDELKAGKEAEIAAAQESVDTKTTQLADNNDKLAQAKDEDTRNSLSADQRYLMDLKQKCQMTDTEWAERQKTRQEEMQAVSKAVAILSNDDAHDTFTRTFNPSLLQTSVSRKSDRRERAASVLRAAGRDFHNKQLTQLATEVQLSAFGKVKKAIDDMVTQLKQEKQDEIKHKDWCVSELNQNERQNELKTRDRGDLKVKTDQLQQTIEQLTKDIDVLNAEIVDLQKQIQRAGEDREKEKADFQTTVRDQQETQKLLA